MKIDHIHFYVEDAAQQRDWFIQKMGFKSIGSYFNNDARTEIVGINSIFFLISSPLTTTSSVALYLQSHPSGVADIAFQVNDIEAYLTKIFHLGIKVIQPTQTYYLDGNFIKWAKIKGWNDLEHTLIENNTSIPFFNIFNHSVVNQDLDSNNSNNLQISSNISYIDHVVLNVESGQLRSAVNFYQRIFNFQIKQTFSISTNYSGLYSEALVDSSGQISFNVNEPSSASSQIQEFINANGGSGIQHIALHTSNIINTVGQMRKLGLSFLSIPQEYYLQQKQKYYHNKLQVLNNEEWKSLVSNQILIDWKSETTQSLLMQIFTQVIFNEPTFFFELIERRNQAQGFGEGNFKALFSAIEQEQIARSSNY